MRPVKHGIRLLAGATTMIGLTGLILAQAPQRDLAGSAALPVERDGPARELHEHFLERAARGDVGLLFLGDSITQSWNDNPIWQRHYAPRRAANFGIGGDRTQHLLWRIQHGELDGIDPTVVVLLIGTNNIGHNPPDEIAAAVDRILSVVQARLPRARILLLGVFPRGIERSLDLATDAPDPVVTDLNSRLSRLGSRPGVRFLDIGHAFLDADGRIPRTLMPDFLHLSREGYRAWADAMEPILWELMEGR